ncbi:membrane-associated Zn-dependent protease 1 [Enterobacter soli]|uniref:membrane-associated Zn-dependent protease 1 n=1 Tax=Enterobacter soli TaxID=885040 RepID=UPI003ED9EDA3
MKNIFAFALMFVSHFAFSQGAVHLTFHIAAGVDESFRVGTTVANKNNESVYGGYIVIIPIGDMCKPLPPVLKAFGTLLPGETKSLEIVINKRIRSYRIASLFAYDKHGFPVAVEDDTKEIINEREAEERKKCTDEGEKAAYYILK